MATIGIVAEYNPFHNGHKYQIDKIREEFGDDTEIVVVMSGNYTQRGESAIYDKFLRARAAVECGVDLVLELPFPFSSSSAECFAKSAVHILNSIGCIEYISFGSEDGDILNIEHTARAMLSVEYKSELDSLYNNPSHNSMGYPKLCELALSHTIGEGRYTKPTPNNILALEYIKALISFKSIIKPHTVHRSGAGYNSGYLIDSAIQSASYIRTLIPREIISARNYLPEDAFELYLSSATYDYKLLSLPIISILRSNDYELFRDIPDLDKGLFHRIHEAAFKCNNVEDLINLSATKKYTAARIRRILLGVLLGVKTSFIASLPEYSQVLAIGKHGKSILKRVKKHSSLPIITKPSNDAMLKENALIQKRFSDMADSVFHLTAEKCVDGHISLRTTPYVIKCE